MMIQPRLKPTLAPFKPRIEGSPHPDLPKPDLLKLDDPETVRHMANRLLVHVDYIHEGRTVGLSYQVILDLIHQKIPTSRTKGDSLREYATLIRSEGALRLPQIRPRTYRGKVAKTCQFERASYR